MKLVHFILSLAHLLILLLLAGTYANAYIPPGLHPAVNLLSLGFPLLMICHTALCVWWLLFFKKRALFFLLMTVAFWKPLERWLNYKPQAAGEANLKIVSMNLHGGQMGIENIYKYLEKTDADIILSQEYGSEFNVPGYPYRVVSHEIVALNSRHEIVSQRKLATVGNGNSFYADIKVNGKMIRVVNVYLNPFSFEKEKVKPAENMSENKTTVKYILRRLMPVFKIHQEEIADIRKAIDASPYPVILAGDFNAVPNSYEYYTLGKGLQDAFVVAGRGSATSFHDYKFPLRIDYVFSSDDIVPVRYSVDRSIKLSDHFPVIAEFKIK